MGEIEIIMICTMLVYQGLHISPLAWSSKFWFWAGETDLNNFSAGSYLDSFMISSSLVKSPASIGYGRFLLTKRTSERGLMRALAAVFVMTDNGLTLRPMGGCSVVEVTCCCCNVALSAAFVGGTILMVMDPPLGGVGNVLSIFCWVCRGGVVFICWYSEGGSESSPLDMLDAGLNGGLVSVDICLVCDFVTLLKALTRGREPVRSMVCWPLGNVDGKNGKLLLFGMTNASSPVGRRDGIS